jgi:hypothetical protein
MQIVDIILSVTSAFVSAVGLLIVYNIVKTSGRDRPRNPKRVQDLVNRENGRGTDDIPRTEKTKGMEDAR